MRAGSFNSFAPYRGWSGGQFTRNSNWAGQRGNWYGRHEWDNYFNRGRYAGWGWGGYWPWYGGWGLGWDWGYPYDYGYYYPNAGEYYYSYAPDFGDSSVVLNPVAAAPQQLADSSARALATSAGDQQAAGAAIQFYSEARADFLEGDYRNALRLGGHAAVEAPRNPKIHELISLALFALGNYRAAAGEAHAAMALGAIADWKDLYAYYNNVDKYTAQLRALEKAAAGNPKDAAEHFLLGYQYLMTGARDSAKTEFADAVKLAPSDKIAAHYLQQLQANAPITPPQMASRPRGQSL
jgi:Flp pilus assembly protein TadD